MTDRQTKFQKAVGWLKDVGWIVGAMIATVTYAATTAANFSDDHRKVSKIETIIEPKLIQIDKDQAVDRALYLEALKNIDRRMERIERKMDQK